MSKVQMMLVEEYHPLERGLEEFVRNQGRPLRPPRPTPPPPPPDSRESRERRVMGAPWGPLYRWVRQANVRDRRCWRPRWLLGLVEVVTYPQRMADEARYVRGMAASCGLPARPAMMMLTAARP